MIEIISISRKPHNCYLCGNTIQAGESCFRWSGFARGKPFAVYSDPECFAKTHGWKWDVRRLNDGE